MSDKLKINSRAKLAVCWSTICPGLIEYFLSIDTALRDKEKSLANGTIDVKILQYDARDDTYYVQIVEKGDYCGQYKWAARQFLTPCEDGLACFECKEVYTYAEYNCGTKLICWSCCSSMGWKYFRKDGKVHER